MILLFKLKLPILIFLTSDHDQQIIIKDNVIQIVCGNGSKTRKVNNRDKMVNWYNDDVKGFGKIEFSTSGVLQVFFYDEEGKELYRRVISD